MNMIRYSLSNIACDRKGEQRSTTFAFRLSLFLIPLSLLMFMGCAKDNLDYTSDYRNFTDEIEPSLIRLVNIGANRNLEINGDSLTNFRWPPTNPEAPAEAIAQTLPTKYFPGTGQLGSTWAIPSEFLSTNRPTEITFHSGRLMERKQHTFSITGETNVPKDYYLLKIEREMHENAKVIEVPRDITAPSRPDHFKIRLLNFVGTFDNYQVTPENLMTPMTLAFADGTPVSPETTNVPIGQWSDYIEVPYGTYQFKVLTEDGQHRQVAWDGSDIQLATSALPDRTRRDPNNNSTPFSSGLVSAPIQTYQPGGVYSIAVHPCWMKYDALGTGGAWISTDVIQNAFQIIRDVSAPVNYSYARIQLVNAALNGASMTLRLSPSLESEMVAPEQYSDYLTTLAGKRTLQVTDATGNILVEQTVDLQAGKNYSFWVYAGQDNSLQGLLVANNLGATYFLDTNNSNVGSYGDILQRQDGFPFSYRFLNLSADLEEITFTDQLGAPFGSNSSRLPFGRSHDVNPYYFYVSNQYAYERLFMLYRSSATQMPGQWISDIPGLSTRNMIANEELYTRANRNIPGLEPGVYTLAVIGKYQDGLKNAKIMYVKHTK